MLLHIPVMHGEGKMDSHIPLRNKIIDGTIKILSRALDYRTRRHAVISGNLANIDTPGYRPKDVEFDETLKRALEREGLPLRRTHEQHLVKGGINIHPGGSYFPIKQSTTGISGQRELDIDTEMAKMAKNNLLYEATVKMLSKKFEELRLVIEGGRR